MKNIPETREDIKKLLYEQVPLLIEKLRDCPTKDIPGIVDAVLAILVQTDSPKSY